MAEAFTRAANWKRFDKREGEWLSTDCPHRIAETFLAREGQWRLPVLTGIINCPTLRADGSILDLPGYDAQTGLLFDPQDARFPALPRDPDQATALRALAFLKDLISTFPFVTDADRSVALSGILTALIRRSLPTAPLHGFNAPTAGTGKSMLADLASQIATARPAPVIAQGKSEEEMEKRLGAALIAGDVLIAIDNCEEPLGGELLCQTLTQTSLKVRILGKSVNAEVPSNAAVFATGNNLTLEGDMTRRAIRATLDAGVERPELRAFDRDPLAMVTAQRGDYVTAGLTVLRAYHIAGRPQQRAPLGSFTDWSRWVRDALIWLGEADPCDTMEGMSPACIAATWPRSPGRASAGPRGGATRRIWSARPAAASTTSTRNPACSPRANGARPPRATAAPRASTSPRSIPRGRHGPRSPQSTAASARIHPDCRSGSTPSWASPGRTRRATLSRPTR